ncbi:hypothetical protein ACFYRN_42115 [Streptomyces sp. NPDC005227]|uniref:hypothetical protein n=1 Tax=unclassified Streptomyces TaxID=2593676 RepID=UPI00368345B9
MTLYFVAHPAFAIAGGSGIRATAEAVAAGMDAKTAAADHEIKSPRIMPGQPPTPEGVTGYPR